MPTAGAPRGATVEVRDLTWRPFGRSRPVLAHLDLTIGPGERVLLAGPSGSGKSTLLRAVAGLLLTADSGELGGTVCVDGVPPQESPGAVGLVLQDPGAGVVASTVGRDVVFGLENLGVDPAEMAGRGAAALAEVGLDVGPDADPGTLSGGESQRLALAGALATAPRLLLLDEPTAMLDAATAATVRDVVADVVTRRHLTLVVVEHRLDGWLDVVDRLVVLDASGAVVADGSPPAVLAEHGETLAAQGIWVPGVPDPEPLALTPPPAPGATAGLVWAGTTVARADAVTVRHRSRRLGSEGRDTVAVDAADLDARAGETVALVGRSGAGKSTLLTALGGLVAPTSGDVWFAEPARPPDGRPDGAADGVPGAAPHTWSSPALARSVAWVPQRAASALVAGTVRDEVLTTPRALGRDDAASAARADHLLDALGLAHLAAADPRHLSGGEQRRLAVAAAVAHAPALVLADEPTVGQDRLTWAAVTGVLEAARREGAAVVVTTHDPGVVARAERTVVLERPPQPAPPTEPERQPLVGRAGPLALFLAALCVLPLPALVDSWRHGLAVLAAELLLVAVGLAAPGTGRRPTGRVRGMLARLAPAAVAVAGVVWSSWLLGGRDVEVAAGAGLRVLALLVPSALVVGHLDPERLGDHLAQRLRLPARPVVAATAALQRVQAFDELWAELVRTRRVRGIGATGLLARGRELLVVTGGLLVGAVGQAAALALAMDARGFAAVRRRTWAGGAPWRAADTVAVVAGLAVVAVGAVARLTLP